MMLSDVEEGDNLMLTKLTPVATLLVGASRHMWLLNASRRMWQVMQRDY